MRWPFIILIPCAALLGGCTHNAHKLVKLNPDATERARELVQGAALANAAADQGVVYIAAVAGTNAVPMASNDVARVARAAATVKRATGAAAMQLSRAGGILGAPAMDQSERIAALLSENAAIAGAAHAADVARIKQESAWMTEKRELEAKLIDYGTKYEAERNKSIAHRFWFWFTGLLGVGTIGGIIALCVLCPAVGAIALPILGRLLGWLVGVMPKLAGFLGVVGNGVVNKIVAGVEAFKGKVDAGTVATLDTTLSGSMDASHKAIVRTVKQKQAIEKVKGI